MIKRLIVSGVSSLSLCGCATAEQSFFHCQNFPALGDRILTTTRVFDSRLKPVRVEVEWIEKQNVPRPVLMAGNLSKEGGDLDLPSTSLELSYPFDEKRKRIELRQGAVVIASSTDITLSVPWSIVLPKAQSPEPFTLVGLDRWGHVMNSARIDTSVFRDAFQAISQSLDRTATLARDPRQCPFEPEITISGD